jgi:hypothetical protein
MFDYFDCFADNGILSVLWNGIVHSIGSEWYWARGIYKEIQCERDKEMDVSLRDLKLQHLWRKCTEPLSTALWLMMPWKR